MTEGDFDKITVLGEGGFGRVVLCKYKNTDEYFAVKILKKSEAVKKGKLESMLREKELLTDMHHPFLLSLDFCFHSESNIFMGMKYCQGGDLFTHLDMNKRVFPEPWVKFYAAQLVLALEYLHFRNILYRDLKPENVCM